MKFKFNMKLLILLCALLFLIFSILCIQGTYARYITALTAKSYVELGSWLITVNNQNILENANLSGVIQPVFDVDSEYIADGKIVPTSTGYIEIVIDYSNVKVPFKYELTCTLDETNFIKDLKFTDYLLNNVTNTYTNSTITNTITPDGVKTKETLKINMSWIDGTGETLTDAQDTKASRDFQNIELPFVISFTQLT